MKSPVKFTLYTGYVFVKAPLSFTDKQSKSIYKELQTILTPEIKKVVEKTLNGMTTIPGHRFYEELEIEVDD